jgi:hypothetical protein
MNAYKYPANFSPQTCEEPLILPFQGDNTKSKKPRGQQSCAILQLQN